MLSFRIAEDVAAGVGIDLGVRGCFGICLSTHSPVRRVYGGSCNAHHDGTLGERLEPVRVRGGGGERSHRTNSESESKKIGDKEPAFCRFICCSLSLLDCSSSHARFEFGDLSKSRNPSKLGKSLPEFHVRLQEVSGMFLIPYRTRC
jgi:hypothetical protein